MVAGNHGQIDAVHVRRRSVAARSCTTTARLSERPARDASFPAVNFNGQRFVPSATERRIASCCIGLPMKQIAGNVTMEDGVRWLGPGVTLFAPGKDGGRDGKFSRKANCAEFRKRRGRRSSGLRVKRGPPPGLPTVLQARLSRCGEHHTAGDRCSSDRRDRPHSHSAEVFW